MEIIVPVNWKSVGVVATVLAGIVGTTAYSVWEIRKDVVDDLKHQAAVVEQSKSWKLPELLMQLNNISEKLQQQFATQEQAEWFRAENTRVTDENAELKKRLDVAHAEAKTLSERLETLEAELRRSMVDATAFNLKEGESAELVKNRVTLGITSVYPTWVTGNLNNSDFNSLNVGKNMEFDVSGKKCVLVLARIVSEVASFNLSCV